jgi:nicotinate-nucleotide adenylyltransferase
VTSTRPRRRVLYGGTFDPIHAAHVAVALSAGRELGADVVSLVPTGDPPHKTDGPYASAEHRLAMATAAASEHPLLDVLDVEARREGVSYTIDTLEELIGRQCRGEALVLLVGQDALQLLPTWHRARDVVALVPIAIAPRPGAPEPPWERLRESIGAAATDALRGRVLRTPMEDVSSTAIRRRAAAGKTIRCWVPDPVADYIEAHGLYTNRPSEGA